MLTHLHIRRFALIDDAELELGAGLTALTGETGAGKSILLGALGLVLGERASSLDVQTGAKRAEIAARFELGALPEVREWLRAEQLDDEDDCVLRRTLDAGGRSRATVNGTPVTLRTLGELGERLVAIHGQHAQQRLARPEEQRRLLDRWSVARRAGGEQDALLAAVGAAHAAWRAAETRYREARDASRSRGERIDLLRFQLQEFDELDAGGMAPEEIESEHRWRANVERLGTLAANALDALEGEAEGGLGRALGPLGELVAIDPRLREALDLAESASIQCAEATRLLRAAASALEHDEARLGWLDRQLAALHRLAGKHGVEPAELGEVERRLREELDAHEAPGAGPEALAAARDEALGRYLERARELGKRRRGDARRLAARVSETMQTLAMEGGRFVVDVESDESRRGADGIDRVEFRVATNPGAAPGPLTRIASGGELSRIALALQLALIGTRELPTLVFDEVDAGIGGAVAETVGRLLRRVGARAQVLCVTHLPQVAARAHAHVRVAKRVAGGRGRTELLALEGQATRDEIARMLGGARLTKKSRQHAQEMLDAVEDGD